MSGLAEKYDNLITGSARPSELTIGDNSLAGVVRRYICSTKMCFVTELHIICRLSVRYLIRGHPILYYKYISCLVEIDSVRSPTGRIQDPLEVLTFTPYWRREVYRNTLVRETL